jgi:excisionase family DNA binding protein
LMLEKPVGCVGGAAVQRCRGLSCPGCPVLVRLCAVTRSQSEYMTIAQAAEMYAVSPKTIRRYISTGELPAYRLGKSRPNRSLRLKRADVEALARPLPTTGNYE